MMFFMNRGNRFKNKVVLVTGGSSGIGQTTAQAFAREGAAVVIVGRREEPLLQTVKLIQDAGGIASYVTANISNAAEVERVIKTCEERHGGLHVAFNNVGILGKPRPTAEIEEDEWAEILAINLTGIWLCMKYEIRYMRTHGGGAIINTASNIGAHQRRSGLSGYVATKAAVSALTRNAAREYIADGIRINAVSPGNYRVNSSLSDDLKAKLTPTMAQDAHERYISIIRQSFAHGGF